MSNLFEYIDPLTSPYHAFIQNTTQGLFPIQQHWHYYIEVLYILNGIIKVQINTASYTATKDSLIFIPGKAMHSIYTPENKTANYVVIKFDENVLNTSESYKSKIRYLLNSLNSDKNLSCFFSKNDLKHYPFKGLMLQIVHEFSQKQYGYDLLINANLQKIFSYMLRIWNDKGYKTDFYQNPRKYEFYFDEITEYINHHYYEDLKAEKLADMCHMSHSTFSKNFRQRYGRSCKEYINYVRTNIAENMLLFTDYDINFISQEIGYSDSSYFIRCYKKLKGLSPKQHQKQMLKARQNYSENSYSNPRK